VPKTLFARNASEDERANELRKLNEALKSRVQGYLQKTESPPDHKPE
jgi:hypothetical protein